MRHLLAWTLVAVAALATAPAARATTATHPNCPRLAGSWYGADRARLQQVIDERGTCSGRPGRPGRPLPPPVAVFDWDNTVTRNDVTDATLAWALKHDKLLRPAHWTDTSEWLTPAADKALTEACGTDVRVGAPLRTSAEARCTDEIAGIRETGTTTSGAPAFAGTWNHRRTVPQYAWVPQLFTGHTPAELSSYARAARREALAAPVGATQALGTHTVPAYVRYYDQQRDLIHTLRRAGFDVYIVSAGSEPITEVWSGAIGIDPAHTLAIRSLLDRHGRITPWTTGCGGVPATRGEAIPYIDGKRCWINQEIYGVHGAAAWKQAAWRHRPAIAGGDADTDVTFVGDATGAHLVVNRNKSELMCRAYDDADGRWLVTPMFIAPLPRRRDPYPCSTTAYNAPDGGHEPLLREDGSVVPDQRDTVY